MNSKMSLTYIGSGVDSGQNNREPYFDFTGIQPGLFLLFNTSENIIEASGTNLFGAVSLAVWNCLYASVTEVANIDGGVVFKVDSNNKAIVKGISASWYSNIIVYRVNFQ